jgi:glycosyltransferase involved in cell wall biosynthesis
VCLHYVIEAVDAQTSGYRVSFLTRWGARHAIAGLRRAQLVTFSHGTGEVLEQVYHLRPVLVTPIPCEPRAPRPGVQNHLPVIVTPGYLSPYKGHDRLPDIKEKMRHATDFVVVGGPNRVLFETNSVYRNECVRLEQRLRQAGIRVLGWVPDDQLDLTLDRSSVAILPYYSTQGGSAMFARLASAGVPVIASHLPEFEWYRSLGAGIVTVEPTSDAFAEKVDSLLDDSQWLDKLRAQQNQFAIRYSWGNFVRELRAIIWPQATESEAGSPVPGPAPRGTA